MEPDPDPEEIRFITSLRSVSVAYPNIKSHLRSDEEKFFKFGSEPLAEPLTLSDLAGPFFMAFAFLSLSLVAFVSEVTFGCQVNQKTRRQFLRRNKGNEMEMLKRPSHLRGDPRGRRLSFVEIKV